METLERIAEQKINDQVLIRKVFIKSESDTFQIQVLENSTTGALPFEISEDGKSMVLVLTKETATLLADTILSEFI
jgi:hypothetical protein